MTTTPNTPQPNSTVPWSDDTWKAIHKVVNDEIRKVQVSKFLPQHRVSPKSTTVPSDTVLNQILSGEQLSTLTIDEGATTRLNEIWTEFALTPQQVHETANAKSPQDTSAATLARRAAQYLALAEDLVVFQGNNGYPVPFFSQNVRHSMPPVDGGLLSLTGGPYLSPYPPIKVQPLGNPSSTGVQYGENTLTAVTQAISTLASQGQPGPYALVLNTTPYADLFAAVGSGSLVVTADRIAPLITAGMFGTSTVPPSAGLPGSWAGSQLKPPQRDTYYGVLVSLGGNTMDLVVGLEATTHFLQQDPNGLWRFRVIERFALRLKDVAAVQVLEFI
jgi:uncharacterized linocin/CFP29 family protein